MNFPPNIKDLSIEEVGQYLAGSGHDLPDPVSVYLDWLSVEHPQAQHIGYYNLGVHLAEGGDWHQAATAYAQAIAIKPDFVHALINAGLVCEKLNQEATAITNWQRALEFLKAQSNHTCDGEELRRIALNHLGRVYERQAQLAEAEVCLLESLKINKEQPAVVYHWHFIRQKRCAWPLVLEGHAHWINLNYVSPLSSMALTDDVMQHVSAAERVLDKDDSQVAPKPAPRQRNSQRIKLGYLAANLNAHAVGYLMCNLIPHHDRQRFEVIAFDASPEDGSAIRMALRGAFEKVVEVHGWTASQIADEIKSHGIDFLIDLHGLSAGARQDVMQLRPCAYQATYLGFMSSTTAPWIDYFIADKTVTTNSSIEAFTEKIMAIEGAMLPFNVSAEACVLEPAVMHGDSAQSVVLACLNHVYKITEATFAVWMRVLQTNENTILWLLDDNPCAKQNLQNTAATLGIEPERIVFWGRTSYDEYKSRLKRIDLYLDTFPYNGGSTCSDVLASGVPVVTQAGQSMASRMAASLLTQCDLSQLITSSITDYERCINSLVAQPERILELKQHLSNRLLMATSMNKQWVAGLETAITEVIEATN